MFLSISFFEKKAKLDLCPTLDNTTNLIDYQQVIKINCDKDFYEKTSEESADVEYVELKNGHPANQLTTNGKSLNNNNLNAINLNNLKTEFNKQADIEQPNKETSSLITQPSHVVHLRNVPNDSTEVEILNFGSTFGATVNCLLLKGKNQAFLEFADLESAKSMISYFILNQQQQTTELNGKLTNSLNQLSIRGRQIFVQYSNYKKLQKSSDVATALNSSHSNNNNQAKNNHNNNKLTEELLLSSTVNALANQQSDLNVQNLLTNSTTINQLNKNLGVNTLNLTQQQLTNNSTNNSIIINKTMGGTNQQLHQQQQTNTMRNNVSSQAQASSVLRVIVDNMLYIVPLETFHDLFSRFGKVTKIVTFNKNGAFQALIQFESNSAAASAKQTYDGQPLFAFSPGNLLRIDYSKLSNLSVKYNNEKSRDFTNSTLPAGPTLTSSVLTNVRNGSSASLVATNSIPGLNTSHLNPQQQLALAAAASAAQQQHYQQHLEHVFSDPLALGKFS